MTFDEWWKQIKPAECDEVKPYFEEAWQTAFRDGYEKGVAAFHVAVAMEREACADVCEAEGDGHRDGFGQHCAAVIRMRSNVEVTGAERASPAKRPCGPQG